MNELKKFFVANRKKMIAILVLLSVSALLAFQGFSDNPYTFKDNSKVEEFNQIMGTIDDEDVSLEEFTDNLSKVERLSERGSFVRVVSQYNMAYLLAVHPEVDVEKLRVARQLLVDALRTTALDPEYQENDEKKEQAQDIAKNLELITAVLIQQTKEELMEEGMSEEKAQKAAIEQETGEMPATGPEPGRGPRHEQDY